jgi:hypothetical protein
VVRQHSRAQLAAGLASAALLPAALSGCLGGDDQSAPPSSAGAGVGGPVRLSDCRDWNAGDPRERRRIVQALRKFIGSPAGSPAGRGATLPDDKAYALFDSYCEHRYARAFKLYKLYLRAAAFTPQ